MERLGEGETRRVRGRALGLTLMTLLTRIDLCLSELKQGAAKKQTLYKQEQEPRKIKKNKKTSRTYKHSNNSRSCPFIFMKNFFTRLKVPKRNNRALEIGSLSLISYLCVWRIGETDRLSFSHFFSMYSLSLSYSYQHARPTRPSKKGELYFLYILQHGSSSKTGGTV